MAAKCVYTFSPNTLTHNWHTYLAGSLNFSKLIDAGGKSVGQVFLKPMTCAHSIPHPHTHIHTHLSNNAFSSGQVLLGLISCMSLKATGNFSAFVNDFHLLHAPSKVIPIPVMVFSPASIQWVSQSFSQSVNQAQLPQIIYAQLVAPHAHACWAKCIQRICSTPYMCVHNVFAYVSGTLISFTSTSTHMLE